MHTNNLTSRTKCSKIGQRGQWRRPSYLAFATFLTIGILYSVPLLAASFELSLKFEQKLHTPSAENARPATEKYTEKIFSDEGERLKLTQLLKNPNKDQEISKIQNREFDKNTPKQEFFLVAIRLLWAITCIFLLAHISREWFRVILVRLRREHKPVPIEFANWPVVTILVIPKGDAPTQEHRLDVLRNLPFDYPPERIHLAVAYHVEDIGVRDALNRLGKALPERVQILTIEPGDDANLATLLPEALTKSTGTALVVLDQHLPAPRDWLKQAVSPLLDPSVGAVLNRTIPGQAHNILATRLVALADHADVLLATQSDAIDLMLCGKARIRALRRSAYKSVANTASMLTPDGASVVLELVRTGWQTVLLANTNSPEPHISLDTIRSPRLHPSVTLQALRLAPLAITRNYPRGARIQGRTVFFAAALPLIWLISLACGLILYAMGDALCGGLAIMLCAATSFDPLGHPRPAFSVAAAARMAGLREEIRLLPLACVSFTDRLIEGCQECLQIRTKKRNSQPNAGDPVLFHQKESA